MYRIERVFYPVGQGAFYSEHFNVLGKEYRVVYDCGTSYSLALAKSVVRQAFSKEDTIDILFISHLDWDHVSLIPTLKESVKKIRHVVLPHVDDHDRFLVSLACQNKEQDKLISTILQILVFPEQYFGEETKIWRIGQSEGGMETEQGRDTMDLDQANNSKYIPSGRRISLTGIMHWCYIPFNYYSPCQFQKKIGEALNSNKAFQDGFKRLLGRDKVSTDDVLQILCDPNLVNKIINDEPLRKMLQGIYDRLEGRINAHSLVLYSGPMAGCRGIQDANRILSKNIYFDPKCFFNIYDWENIIYYGRDIIYSDLYNRVACIYNGDSNYSENKLKNGLRDLWEYVGTIQVAHHGSRKSHDFNCFDESWFLCPVSFGKSNNYGHPSMKVMSDLLSKRRIPIFITEDLDSGVIQVIHYTG